MVFCLLFVTVQPWKLPIPFMEKEALIEATQSGLGLPASEEETLDEKVQNNSEAAVVHSDLIRSVLPLKGTKNIPPSPYFEVPTPPPRV
jgi:hypothetical protein